MRFSGSSFIILICWDCHNVVLLHLYTFSQGINQSIRFFIAHPLHGAPHTFRNLFIQKGQIHLLPYLPAHNSRPCMVLDPRLIFSSFHRNNFVIFSFPNLKNVPMSAVSTTSFHFQTKRRHTHRPPNVDILPSTEHVGYEMLFLCFGFAVPSTSRSPKPGIFITTMDDIYTGQRSSD